MSAPRPAIRDVVAAPPLMNLRLVHYFVAVAEHRHFGQAATALRLAQPSLSRQVQRLENDLGVRLFDRTPQGIDLTPAGVVFLAHARELLRCADRAVTAALDPVDQRRMVIGFATGLIVSPVVRELRHRHPDADIQARHLEWNEPGPALSEHIVDAAVTRLPLATEGLDVTPLYEDPRVLVVPHGHRLAGETSVTLDDIADEPLIGWSDADWNAFWRVDPRPDGRRAPDGPEVDDFEDKLELVAGGDALALAPAGFQPARLHPEVATVPLQGVAPVSVVFASRSGDDNELLAESRATILAELGPGADPAPEQSARRS